MKKYQRIILDSRITFFWVLIVLVVSICKVFFQVDPVHDGTFYSSGFALNDGLKLYSEVATSYGPIRIYYQQSLYYCLGTL